MNAIKKRSLSIKDLVSSFILLGIAIWNIALSIISTVQGNVRVDSIILSFIGVYLCIELIPLLTQMKVQLKDQQQQLVGLTLLLTQMEAQLKDQQQQLIDGGVKTEYIEQAVLRIEHQKDHGRFQLLSADEAFVAAIPLINKATHKICLLSFGKSAKKGAKLADRMAEEIRHTLEEAQKQKRGLMCELVLVVDEKHLPPDFVNDLKELEKFYHNVKDHISISILHQSPPMGEDLAIIDEEHCAMNPSHYINNETVQVLVFKDQPKTAKHYAEVFVRNYKQGSTGSHEWIKKQEAKKSVQSHNQNMA
jgi:hypothetical protein